MLGYRSPGELAGFVDQALASGSHQLILALPLTKPRISLANPCPPPASPPDLTSAKLFLAVDQGFND